MGRYTRIRLVSVQRLGKHYAAEMNAHTTGDLLLETGSFYVVRAEML